MSVSIYLLHRGGDSANIPGEAPVGVVAVDIVRQEPPDGVPYPPLVVGNLPCVCVQEDGVWRNSLRPENWAAALAPAGA